MVLQGGKIQVISNLAGRYPFEEGYANSYYLFDAGTRTTQPRISKSKLSIFFSSPDRRNYVDYEKNQTDYFIYYMPVWSFDELKLLPNPSKVNLTERIWYFGGIPRYIFSYAKGSVRDLECEIMKCNITTLKDFICGNANSHKVLHLFVDTKTYKRENVSVGFASPYVTELYYKQLEEQSKQGPLDAINQLAGSAVVSAARGQLFEIWAHKFLSKGGEFEISSLDTGGIGKLTLPSYTNAQFTNLQELIRKHSFTDAIYLQPTQCNFPAIDSLAQNRLFQMTVGKEQDITMNGLNETLFSHRTFSTFSTFSTQVRPLFCGSR